MDKTIEIVVVAMIALLVASILLFLVQDRTTSYSDFLGSQQEGAQCKLWKTQYKDSGCEDQDLEDKLSENSCETPTCSSGSEDQNRCDSGEYQCGSGRCVDDPSQCGGL